MSEKPKIDWQNIINRVYSGGKNVVGAIGKGVAAAGSAIKDVYGGLKYGTTTVIPKGGPSYTRINWPEGKIPTPPKTPQATAQPTVPPEIQKIIPPTKQPQVQMMSPTPTPTSNIDSIIDKWWGGEAENARLILSKENAERKTGKEVDIPNRIDPATGKWDDNAPITKGLDPFTKESIDSIDRGLFRINNITFLTWLNGKEERQKMYEAGIIDNPYPNWDGLYAPERQRLWDSMLDPEKNTRFAKLLYDTWGPEQWAVVRDGTVKLMTPQPTSTPTGQAVYAAYGR